MATLGATPSTTTFPATAADVGADPAGTTAAHEADTTSIHGIADTANLLTNPMTTAADLIVGGASGVPARLAKGSDGQVLTVDPTTHLLVWATPSSGGAPTTVDYLVGTADGGLSNEIVVGTSPGGELGGTWGSPTVDATHSGSSHAGLSGQPGSTDVAVADGGTGAGTAAGARTNLGLGVLAVESSFPNYGATGILAETIDRNKLLEVNSTVLTSGRLQLEIIYLRAGITVSNIIWCSATTAAVTPTNWLFGLFDVNRNLLASSADQLTAAWAAQTVKTLAMTTPYLVPTSGLYYLGMFMAAATLPTLKGNTNATRSDMRGLAPIIGGTSSTGLTTAMPNPAAAIAVGTAGLYAAVS